MPRPNEAAFLHYVLKGHRQAITFCQLVFRISQTWDDLIDKDEEVSDHDINRAFWMALVEIPSNPFYVQHHSDLVPLLRQYISDWLDANHMERSHDHNRNVAFVLRDSVGSLVGQCAYLVGGYEWQQEVGVQIKEHIFEETLETYKEKLETRS